MKRRNANSIIISLPLLVSFSILPTSLAADDGRYTDCRSSSFSCGIQQNLTYPFWGGERADYCGFPDFQLTCESNIAKITIGGLEYRLLEWVSTSNVLVVARDDYSDTICPRDYMNNTIDPTKFEYVDGLINMTFLYDCPPISESYTVRNCQRDNDTSTTVYYVPGPVYVSGCKSSVVPVYEEYLNQAASSATPDLIQGVVEKGFGLQWMVNNEVCNTCSQSGGECGYEGQQFSCFCKDGPHNTTCSEGPPSEKKSKSKVTTGIIAAAAAGAFLILLGLCLFFMVRRRKRIAEQSQSKDLFMAPFSRGVATSTTNSSQSVPSYITSKTESMQHSFFYGVKVFSYAELEEATKNFDPSMELGNGGFGTVYYGTLKDGRTVAVKRLYESNLKRVDQFRNEVEILAKLHHKNLVELYGCTSRHSRELLLVYEYIPNGTVSDHLQGNRSKSSLLPWPTRLNIAIETADALAYLHRSDIIHRDVKTNNILLDHKFCVKVADFGLSRLFPNDVTHVSTAPQGTPGYVDPEYYQCYQLTNKSDVYSFGVVLVELISSLEAVDITRHRHDINLANLAINRIQNHQVHELIDPLLGFERDNAIKQMTTAVAELAFRCLQQDGDMRPSMDEVLEVLRGIQKEGYGRQDDAQNHKRVDEIMLLKDAPPPFSPDSVADKWVSSSTASSSL
ncbi:LEAF RUST 10 DISEASE-RESISTANCE LOCUS RECEPTOR-LIKE PROTEIN KINASE-like 1.4 isoform X4 [Prosopis cineraria]|uniref:LEAF RUST 10 DISEASE-RESISTANCE LOCUS RECEPTOR-LIKE PROTEIN KINASE-like 1.4 isoform X4 n=1 Tax=Prosopis cineraria TaxID=364024 RepID=UPI0024101B54|nr:LEAF RUST 10 DISEASE-RESISTANCE LOCUS RECEPTOR-LIKE PROTEIN KINASE-like 1.4 isoform X4 [Prosopis cineraria]